MSSLIWPLLEFAKRQFLFFFFEPKQTNSDQPDSSTQTTIHDCCRSMPLCVVDDQDKGYSVHNLDVADRLPEPLSFPLP
jgi:hypothetical protein